MAVHTACFNHTLAANTPMPIIAPSNDRRLVSISCAFGMGVVRYSVARSDFAANQSGWPRLPAAGQWLWTLEPGEGLWARTDIATDIGGSIKDVG